MPRHESAQDRIERDHTRRGNRAAARARSLEMLAEQRSREYAHVKDEAHRMEEAIYAIKPVHDLLMLYKSSMLKSIHLRSHMVAQSSHAHNEVMQSKILVQLGASGEPLPFGEPRL